MKVSLSVEISGCTLSQKTREDAVEWPTARRTIPWDEFREECASGPPLQTERAWKTRMRRTVTLEIDTSKFDQAFRGMTGEAARDLLVMLVCGGHSVTSHSLCLTEAGIRTVSAPQDSGTADAHANANISRAAEEFLEDYGQVGAQDLLAALADKPKPGAKARGRAALSSMLSAVHALKKSVEYGRPLALACTAEDHENLGEIRDG